MAPQLSDLASGVAFGSALYAAGVFAPAVIIDQMAWRDLTMLRAFMTASGASALIFRVAQDSGYADMPNRQPRNLGLFDYDGNVFGGALIGAGMAVTGACPGTVFVQAAISVPHAGLMLLGGVLGGWLARFVPLRAPQRPPKVGRTMQYHSWAILVAWEAVCFAVVSLSHLVETSKGRATYGIVSPVTGGALIGLAQATTIVLRRQPLGISAAFSDLGSHCALLAKKLSAPRKVAVKLGALITPALVFAGGTMLGAWTMAQARPAAAILAQTSVGIASPAITFVGSALMCLGARVAGGCTSGHGISGLSAFQTASIVTTTAMFAAGTMTALAI